jgi:hypothetical protein
MAYTIKVHVDGGHYEYSGAEDVPKIHENGVVTVTAPGSTYAYAPGYWHYIEVDLADEGANEDVE